MRGDDRHPLVADGDFGQQPRIGHRKAVEVGRSADGERAADESLLVDDLRIAEFLFGADDIINGMELVLEFEFFAVEALDLCGLLGDLLGQGLHFYTHLGEVFTKPVDFGRFFGESAVHVGDHLFEPLDPEICLAQQSCGVLQGCDFLAVLLQQAVDGGDVVVDLLDGTADAFGFAGDGD